MSSIWERKIPNLRNMLLTRTNNIVFRKIIFKTFAITFFYIPEWNLFFNRQKIIFLFAPTPVWIYFFFYNAKTKKHKSWTKYSSAQRSIFFFHTDFTIIYYYYVNTRCRSARASVWSSAVSTRSLQHQTPVGISFLYFFLHFIYSYYYHFAPRRGENDKNIIRSVSSGHQPPAKINKKKKNPP